MARKVRQKLGELLVSWGTVPQGKVDEAVANARGRGMRLGEALVEAGVCKDEDVAKALATQFAADGHRVQSLLRAIVLSPGFRRGLPPAAEEEIQ